MPEECQRLFTAEKVTRQHLCERHGEDECKAIRTPVRWTMDPSTKWLTYSVIVAREDRRKTYDMTTGTVDDIACEYRLQIGQTQQSTIQNGQD